MYDLWKTYQELIAENALQKQRIKELEKSEAEFKDSEDKLRNLSHIQSLILDNTIMGVGFVRNRTFEWVNKRLSTMLGLPLEQIKDSSTRIIYASDDDYEKAEHKIYPALKRGEWC